MILSYLLRLLCLCFASFFALNVALGLAVRLFSRSAIRFAETKPPGAAARHLLLLRLLPFFLAALFVLALCIPSYLWLEPAATAERVGSFCAVLGIFGAATCSLSLIRAARAVLASSRYKRFCASAGRETRISGGRYPVVIVEQDAPLVVLSGLLHSRLLISRGVLQKLSPEELDIALRHEQAHLVSRDNAKRLLLLFAPDIFPLIQPLRILEDHWSKFTEWAADDRAVAGDSRHALSLASALVRVARMGAGLRLPLLSASLLTCDRELSTRVHRLLHPSPAPFLPARQAPLRLPLVGFLLAAGFLVILLAPSALSAVHELLEIFIH